MAIMLLNKVKVKNLRGEKAPLGREKGDEDLVVRGNLAQDLGELVVLALVHGVELLLVADGDNGDTAGVLDREEA